MRKWNWLGMAMMAILMSMNLVSCSQENDAVLPEQPAEEYVTVKLGVTGEYLELSESPLGTRTEGDLKDLIGIQVYTVSESGTTGYAYGVFNSLDNVSIKLLQGQKYKFATSIIVDGDGGVGFSVSKKTDFTYSSNISFDSFYFISPNKMGLYKYDRFYGELAEYTPTENGIVEIATKRTAYGAHYIAEGLTEGELTVGVNSNNGLLYLVEISSENPESDEIYTFRNIQSAWEGKEVRNPETSELEYADYYTTKQLTFKWTKVDGSEIPLGTYDVTFKRNVKTTIRIKVAEPGFQNGIVITREDDALSEDENEYVIEEGEITEVPVTQE